MRILKDHTVGLVIDIQERLFPHIFEHQQMALNTVTLVKGLQHLGIPVMITQQYTKGLGESIQPVRELFSATPHIEKVAFSCCDDVNFVAELARIGRKNVVIAGIESHVCVLQTCTDLLMSGYQPVIVEDCVSSRRPGDKKVAIDRMRSSGAVITTSESILFELLRYSGTPEFKEISKLVK
jgi:nicotinamidase-related amidase